MEVWCTNLVDQFMFHGAEIQSLAVSELFVDMSTWSGMRRRRMAFLLGLYLLRLIMKVASMPLPKVRSERGEFFNFTHEALMAEVYASFETAASVNKRAETDLDIVKVKSLEQVSGSSVVLLNVAEQSTKHWTCMPPAVVTGATTIPEGLLDIIKTFFGSSDENGLFFRFRSDIWSLAKTKFIWYSQFIEQRWSSGVENSAQWLFSARTIFTLGGAEQRKFLCIYHTGSRYNYWKETPSEPFISDSWRIFLQQSKAWNFLKIMVW